MTELPKLKVSLPLSLTWTDYPNSSDCAVIIYFTGCKHNCPGCQNPELQEFNGTEFDAVELFELTRKEAEKAKTNKIVLSGGDAYFQDETSLRGFLYLLYENGFEVCFYTGGDRIRQLKLKFFPYVAYYKCGKYDEQNKEKEWGKFSDRMVFVSKNQKLYNRDGKQISVDNVYWFKRIDAFKAKVVRFFSNIRL